MTFVSMAFLLFFVIDPIGNIPIFLGVLRRVAPERRRRVILRECGIGFAGMIVFMCFGKVFLSVMHLSATSLGIAGGIILFLIALRMIFPTSEPIFGPATESEPILFPLAVPTIAGPSALTTVLLLVSRDPSRIWVCVASLSVAMALSTAILTLAEKIAAFVGHGVMTAAERLMGLILTAVAVEMFLEGVRAFVETLR